MKKSLLLGLLILPALLGTSCDVSTKKVDVYRKAGEVEKQIRLKFFSDSPNVPYISVKQYFSEFFNTDVKLWRNSATGYAYLYQSRAGEYMLFDIEKQVFTTNGVISFGSHPDFSTSTGKLFIKWNNSTATPRETSTINLKDYSIKIYERFGEAYAPLTFLSDLAGSLAGYDIAYNGENIYVFDTQGYLGDPTNASTFGLNYLSTLNNVNEPRPDDLVQYTYNQLCFTFDHLRGNTKQLVFGDEKLQTLGLNKLLETEHPKIKSHLLSTDKTKYYEGLAALFNGLYDGGHTGLTFDFTAFANAKNKKSETDFISLKDEVEGRAQGYRRLRNSYLNSRKEVLGVNTTTNNYYMLDAASKTAFIGFNKFTLDVNGWDDYYNGRGPVPVSTDTYAYVRDKVYQAKIDGVGNLILDLTANTGGSSYCLEGILGLFNDAKGYFNNTDVLGQYTQQDNHDIDINLDGKFDELDSQEVANFNFNVGVLTSNVSFSCGNLLPFNMKELGYKIIGDKTGGGSCAVSIDSTADGISYAHSSYLCLTDKLGENIDGGVEVDKTIEIGDTGDDYFDCSLYYDIASIGEYLSKAYNK